MTVPSPNSHRAADGRPETCPIRSRATPLATLVTGATIATLNAPVTKPLWYSSQPIEGGLSQVSPSRSEPPAKAELPAPRTGEFQAGRQGLNRKGSLVMVFPPLLVVLQQ